MQVVDWFVGAAPFIADCRAQPRAWEKLVCLGNGERRDGCDAQPFLANVLCQPRSAWSGWERGSGCRLAVKRCALGPAVRPAGDGVAEHPLGGCEVGPGARRCGDRDLAVLLQGAVAGGVARDSVLPAAPQDATPGATEGA